METLVLWAAVLPLACAAASAVVTSDANGGWSNSGYYVHNNMWNSAKYHPCMQTLYARSCDNWYVVAREPLYCLRAARQLHLGHP